MKTGQLFAALILATTAATASATLIEVKMTGYVPVDPISSTGSIPSLAAGSIVSTSFILDTGSVGSADLLFGTFSGPGFPPNPVLNDFDVANVLTRDIMLLIDGISAGPTAGTFGSTRYDGFLSSPTNGTDYDLFMAVTAPGFSFNFQDFNLAPAGAIAQADLLAAADPLASLLFSYGTTPAFAYLTGTFGQIAFAVDSLVMRDVPEPGTLGLFVLSGVLMLVRKRRIPSGAARSTLPKG